MGKHGGSKDFDPKLATIAKRIASKRPYGIQLKTLKLCFEKAFNTSSPVDLSKEEKKSKSKCVTDFQCYSQNSKQFESSRAKLIKCLGIRNMYLKQKQYESSKNFKKLHDLWKGRNIYVEPSSIRRKTRHRGFEQSPDDYSQHRVNTKFSFHTGDVVRSEKEFLETLQSLASAEDCNQDGDHSTTAKIPSMIENPIERSLFPMNNSNGKILNPKEYFIGCSEADVWTSKEQRIFLKAFLKFPKQFGRISGFLPNKTTSQCILYYYRNKFSRNLNGLLEEKSYCDNTKSHNKNNFGLNKRQPKSNVSKFKPLKTKQEKEGTFVSLKPTHKKSKSDQTHDDTFEEPVSSSSYVSLKDNSNLQQAKTPEIQDTQAIDVNSDSATDIMSLNQEDIIDDTPQIQSSCASPKINSESVVDNVSEALVKDDKIIPNEEISAQQSSPVNKNFSNNKLSEKHLLDLDSLPQSIPKTKSNSIESPNINSEIQKPASPVIQRVAKIDALLNSPTSTHGSKEWDQTAILEWFGGHNLEDPVTTTDCHVSNTSPRQRTPTQEPLFSKTKFEADQSLTTYDNEPNFDNSSAPLNKPSSSYFMCNSQNEKNDSFFPPTELLNIKPTISASYSSSYLNTHTIIDPSYRNNDISSLSHRVDLNTSKTLLPHTSNLQKNGFNGKTSTLPKDYASAALLADCQKLHSVYPPGYPESINYPYYTHAEALAPRPLPSSGPFIPRQPQRETSFQYFRSQLARDSQRLDPSSSFRYIQPSSNLTLFSPHSENIPTQFRFHRPVIDLHSNNRIDQNTLFPYSDYSFQATRETNGLDRGSRSQKHTLSGYNAPSLSGSFTHNNGNNDSHLSNSQFIRQSLLQKSLQEPQFQKPSHPHLLHKPIIQTSRTSLRAPTEPLPNSNESSNFYPEHSSNQDYLPHMQQNFSNSSLNFPEVSHKQGSVPPRFDQKDGYKKV